MAKVQLLVNIIFDGMFHPRGAVMESQKLPPNLRNRSDYVGEPGSVEPLYLEEESGSHALGENDYLNGEGTE